jgi:hypothetical protein
MTKKKRPVRSSVDDKYHIDGNTYDKVFGERREVWARRAYKTSGGLKRSDLIQNNAGRIISKKKYDFEKKFDRLRKYGWTACKGHFGGVPIKKTQTKASACKTFLTKKNKPSSKTQSITQSTMPRYMTRSKTRAKKMRVDGSGSISQGTDDESPIETIENKNPSLQK